MDTADIEAIKARWVQFDWEPGDILTNAEWQTLGDARTVVSGLVAEVERLNAAIDLARAHLTEALTWTDSGGACADWIRDAIADLDDSSR